MQGGFTFGLVLSSTALAVVPFLVALTDRLLPRPPVFFARWGFTHVLVCALIGLLVASTLALVPGSSGLALLGKGVSVTGAMVVYAGWVAKQKHPEGWAALGFRAANARPVWLALTSFALLAPAYLGILWLWPWLAQLLGIEFEPQKVLLEILALRGTWMYPVALVLAIAVQPFFEEVLFRGFIQPLLVQNLHAVGGIVVTSLLFARLHGLPAMLPIFVLSLLLGWVQLRTGRILAAWAVHAANNAIMLAVGWSAET